MDIRTRLLEAAAQVFAETGYRGATTRRIASEAGVNEITLFRHFGSKDALILEALRCASLGDQSDLPEVPRHPEHELTLWCRARFETLFAARSLVRKLMGEVEEHPEVMATAKDSSTATRAALTAYVLRLQDRDLASREVSAEIAAAMLHGALFAQAMGRDTIPELHPYGVDEAIAGFVRLFLRALGTPLDIEPGESSDALESQNR
jgi:AcrR family transcriptional regulator